MSPRQRLTAALRREPVDRPPWTVDLAYYNAAMQAQGRLDARHQGPEGELTQQLELGADPYFAYGVLWPWEIRYDGVQVETRSRDNDNVTTWTLDGASLEALDRYLPESYCSARVKHPVETAEDLALLLEILRRGRVTLRMERHRERQEQWADRGLAALGAPRTPLPALITEWCGVTAVTFLAFDEPGLFAEVLQALDRLQDPIFEGIADYAPVAVHFTDNLSGEVVLPFWDEHMAPVYERRLKQLHVAGIVCAVHNDGTVRGVLGRIAEAGFDAAEALTPAPVGDVAPEDLRAEAGREDFILWGMVPGAMFAPSWTDEQFRDHVARVLEGCGGSLMLGTADQVPPDGRLQRVALVARMLAEFGTS